MRDMWNPWHGCAKYAEGCDNCYMYFLDKERGVEISPSILRKTKNFDYPLKKDRKGAFKIRSGETLRVNMAADSFQPEAREWLSEVWRIVKQRPDVIFYFLTKRAEHIEGGLPSDWGNDGYENVILNLTCESQKAFDSRWPYFEKIPARMKAMVCAPMISAIDIEPALATGQLYSVSAAGENYGGARLCRYEWVEAMSRQCLRYSTTFRWHETGTIICKGNKGWKVDKYLQAAIAGAAGLNVYFPKPSGIVLRNPENGRVLTDGDLLHVPMYNVHHCLGCSSKGACNGCDPSCKRRDKSYRLATLSEMRELEVAKFGRFVI